MPTEPGTQPTMTFEEAARLDPDEQAGEIDHGRWVPVTKNTWSHGELVTNIASLLWTYARTSGKWRVSSGDPGARLKRNPDVLRGPDVAVIDAARRPTGKGAEGWLSGAPDLAVEVAGDDQSATELARKALEYLGAGGKLVWVVDGSVEQVMVFTPPNHLRVLGRDDVLDGGEALPGFECRVSELFE